MVVLTPADGSVSLLSAVLTRDEGLYPTVSGTPSTTVH